MCMCQYVNIQMITNSEVLVGTRSWDVYQCFQLLSMKRRVKSRQTSLEVLETMLCFEKVVHKECADNEQAKPTSHASKPLYCSRGMRHWSVQNYRHVVQFFPSLVVTCGIRVTSDCNDSTFDSIAHYVQSEHNAHHDLSSLLVQTSD